MSNSSGNSRSNYSNNASSSSIRGKGSIDNTNGKNIPRGNSGRSNISKSDISNNYITRSDNSTTTKNKRIHKRSKVPIILMIVVILN